METQFTRNQLKRFANILDNAGQVFLAGAVLTPLISNVDNDRKAVILLGIVLTGGSWWLALRIERNLDQ